jgi:hypothetical protein
VTRTGRFRPTTDIWTHPNAVQLPLRAPGARQTARISSVPLRGQSADLQGKCRRFRPMEQWKRFAFSNHGMEAFSVWTSCGMVFFLAGGSARHMSLRRFEPRWTVFNSRSRAQTKDDAGGRSASDGGPASGAGRSRWAIVAPGRPSRAVTTRRAVRVHRPDAFGTALLARWARPRMQRSFNDRHMPAMPSHARQRQNSSLRQSRSPICIRSDFCQSGCAAGSTMNAT